MRKMGFKTTKAVLVLHFCCLALWLGGVLSCLPLLFGIDVSDYNTTYTAYIHMRAIAWNVIGWGGIGSFFTGVILSVFTKWGLFRHRWVMIKFFLVVGLILFGMFFNEYRILANIGMLENRGINTLNNHVFLGHHAMLKIGMMVSAVGFVLVIVIAVYKPWMRKRIQAI